MSFISYLINGLSLGSVYAIIALGYTMVYGIAKMLNFAHGDVIMIGAYVALTCMTSAGLPPLVSVLIAVVACTVLGVLIERIAYKPLRNAASPLAVLITAIGVSCLLQNVALLIFGANNQSFQSVVSWAGLSLAGGALNITGETIVTIVVCVIIMVGLMLFIRKSKAGQAMRAVSEDKGAAQLMGVLDGGGHQGVGLVAGEAEHHALVAGAGVAGQVVGAVHAHGDVAGLLVDGGEDGAGVAVEAGRGAVVADAPQGLSGHGGDVHIALGGDFAHDQHHAGGGGALAGHPRHGILGQNGVQDAVGNLVTDLVGMTFRDGFRGKNTFLHG